MPEFHEEIGYLSSANGLLPSAASPSWVKAGSGSITIAPLGYDLNDASGTERLAQWLQVEPDVDARVPLKRGNERMEFQIRVQGQSHSGSFSPLVIWIDDGARSLAVRIGSTLAFVDPFDLAGIRVIQTGWPWTVQQYYRLIKDRSDTWVLWVGERELATLGYESAPPAVGRPTATGFTAPGRPGWGWGSLSNAESGRAFFDRIEWSVGLAVPAQWQVDRTMLDFPVAQRKQWTDIAEGRLRATVGLWQSAQETLKGAWRGITAGTTIAERAFYSGELLPTAEQTPWVALNAPGVAVVSERVRLTADGSADTGSLYTYTDPVFADQPEYQTRAVWYLESTPTPDAFGRAGPVNRAYDGLRVGVAQLIEVTTDQYAWVLTTDVTDSAPVVEIGTRWPVDPFQRHDVEVITQKPDWVYLAVSGQIVDRVRYDLCSFG